MNKNISSIVKISSRLSISSNLVTSLLSALSINNSYSFNFTSNVNYTFGFSSGKVTCNPPASRGTGSYTVTCTATGNNGLTASTSFAVKHSYPPTWTKINCNPYSCCYRSEYSCGWCVNGAWGCCDPPCWGCCLQGTYCQDSCVQSGTCYHKCDHPTCPQGGSYRNGMCEY